MCSTCTSSALECIISDVHCASLIKSASSAQECAVIRMGTVHVHVHVTQLHVHCYENIEYFTQCGSSPDGEELPVDP